MLNHLITELDNRFEEEEAGIDGELAQILPSEFCSAKSKSFQEVLRMKFHQLRHYYIQGWIYDERNGKVKNVKAKQLDTPTKALSFVNKD